MKNYKELSLVSETTSIRNKNTFGKLEIDEFGYFHHPMSILGVALDNSKNLYDPKSIINEINGPSTLFHKKLMKGRLYGKLEHPQIPDNLDLNIPYNQMNTECKYFYTQLMTSTLECASHHFHRFKVSDKNSSGHTLVSAYIRPLECPDGDKLKDMLLNEKINTAFSIRSIMREVDGVRHIVQLITWDAVSDPGDEKATKQYLSTENCNINLSIPINDALHKYKNYKLTPTGKFQVSLEELSIDGGMYDKIYSGKKMDFLIGSESVGYVLEEEVNKNTFYSIPNDVTRSPDIKKCISHEILNRMIKE